MTEQIIIDGVDVSGCDRLNIFPMRYGIEPHEICLTSLEQWGGQEKYCKDRPNCYYKQLKRKEQECERLSKGYAELTDIVSPYMDDFTGYNEELGGFDLILCVKELLEQLDQLKAENDELKKKCNIYTCGICGNKEDCNKLYKTLTEIKEIAYELTNEEYTDFIESKQEQILEKCEVLDE